MYGNRITVVGNLTKDPILKYLPTGKAVINFTVACNHGRYDRETQSWVEGEAAFFKIECWEVLAENISDTLRKGDPVIVVGRMICQTYEQDGKTRESWELKAETVGPDLRKRAASLRRVLRSGQSAQTQPSSDIREFDVAPDVDLESLEAAPPEPNLAVAS
ncbi:MAG: single-stranded DNA-binding protein [Actinomycetota bacterium]|nr:single-stranded DNA-binding protein [Actinomycetota bacterium]